MNPEMSNRQLVRLKPESVKAIDLFRKSIKRVTGKTPSINTAINSLIVAGYETSDPVQLEAARKQARKAQREATK